MNKIVKTVATKLNVSQLEEGIYLIKLTYAFENTQTFGHAIIRK
jgi:hypothetical protein